MLKWTLGLLIWLTCATFVAAQGLPDGWFDIPDDRGALAIVIRGNVQGRTFLAQDASAILDEKIWDSKLPIARQYRLLPGVYTVMLPEALNPTMKSVEVEIKAKTLSVLDLSPESGIVTAYAYGQDGLDKDLRELIGSYYGTDVEKLVSPLELSPDAKVIRFDTSPPFAPPPPPK